MTLKLKNQENSYAKIRMLKPFKNSIRWFIKLLAYNAFSMIVVFLCIPFIADVLEQQKITSAHIL